MRQKRDRAAHGLLRRAYRAEYRHPQHFGGFRAGVYYAWDRESWAGVVEARSPTDIRYGGRLQNADGQLHWELASIVNQCEGTPQNWAESGLRLSLDPEGSPHGSRVRVENDGLDSTYRIQGGRICQIERRYGDLEFSINVQERTFTTDGRTLPAHFCIVYWSVEHGRIVRTDICRDGYLPVDDVYLPLSRRITTADDSGITTRLIRFRDHELLRATSGQRYGP